MAPVFVSAPEMPERKVRTLDVRITAAGRTLVVDRLRIRDGQGASLSTNRTEASRLACKTPWQSGDATGINISIYAQNGGDDPTYRFSFNWSRPGPETDGCSSMGTQRVGIDQTVSFAKNPHVVLRGDAETVVDLRLVDGAP
ncbi:hypothetical protein SPAN111604_05810 [Sphingomonas antarctica]|uniref:hypothetical protein n=1 Tax=Sphingomonas antarctica TaxID=2040274 RepID=UPI0039E96804